MKLNKKGFTLIELIAVVSILAILMLLLTPNVLNLFNQSKESAFKTQVQSIIKAAEQQYISDAIDSGAASIYSTGGTKLDVSENASVNYCVKFNNAGVIEKISVVDTKSKYYYEATTGDLSSVTATGGTKTITYTTCATTN